MFHRYKWSRTVFVLLLILIVSACTAQPEVIEREVTRVVTEVEEVAGEQVEVTRIVTETVVEEVEVTSTPSSEETAAGATMNTMVLGTCCEPNSLDPATMGPTQTEGYAINAAYEGLTRYSREGEIIPRLATEWEISDDGLVYTFHLREGVTFHDGTEFNAEAVKVSFERHKDMGLGGLTFVLDPLSEITVIDDHTVEMTLSEPDLQFWLGLPHIKIISPTALEENRQDGDWAEDFFRDNAVGTGPYQVVRWDRGRQTDFVAYDDYWKGWEGPHITNFTIRYGLDYSTRLLQLEEGEIHMIDWAGLSDVRRAATNEEIRLNYGEPLQGFYHFLKHDGPLADVRVRRALMYAFPYQDMIDVMGGFATPMTSAVPENMTGYCETFEPVQDMEKARELLAEAGYPDGFEMPLTQAYRHANEPRRLAAQLFQETLAELGIEVVLEDIPWGTFVEAQRNFDTAYDMSSHWVASSIPYAGDMLFRLDHSSLIGTGAGNWAWYDNPDFDALLAEAPTYPPGDPRIDELLCEAQQILIDDAVFIPVMVSQYMDLTRTELKGYAYDPYGFPGDLHLYELYLESD